MMAFRHTCATPWLSLMARRCSSGETHRGQQETPAVTLPHGRDGLSARWMAVLCPFRRPSMCRPVHCELMRSELLDLTTIVPATPCHLRNYVAPYSRSIAQHFRPRRHLLSASAYRAEMRNRFESWAEITGTERAA